LRVSGKQAVRFISTIMQKEKVLPDFLIIPYQIIVDPKLNPADRILYGLIYWYPHMKLEKCVAGNDTLAELLGVEVRTVERALGRLEEQKYIARYYKDVEKKNRTYIEALVSFNRPNSRSRPTKKSYVDRPNSRYINKTYKEDLSTGHTPKLKTLKERYPDVTS
jgi:DNA-binding transcriptional regulator YhcF (GntR family)